MGSVDFWPLANTTKNGASGVNGEGRRRMLALELVPLHAAATGQLPRTAVGSGAGLAVQVQRLVDLRSGGVCCLRSDGGLLRRACRRVRRRRESRDSLPTEPISGYQARRRRIFQRWDA